MWAAMTTKGRGCRYRQRLGLDPPSTGLPYFHGAGIQRAREIGQSRGVSRRAVRHQILKNCSARKQIVADTHVLGCNGIGIVFATHSAMDVSLLFAAFALGHGKSVADARRSGRRARGRRTQ